MKKTRVILIGGFLGAGKTTLVAKAAEQLVRQGKRVGLITNDQAASRGAASPSQTSFHGPLRTARSL